MSTLLEEPSVIYLESGGPRGAVVFVTKWKQKVINSPNAEAVRLTICTSALTVGENLIPLVCYVQ
jgi:hypothetical protein